MWKAGITLRVTYIVHVRIWTCAWTEHVAQVVAWRLQCIERVSSLMLRILAPNIGCTQSVCLVWLSLIPCILALCYSELIGTRRTLSVVLLLLPWWKMMLSSTIEAKFWLFYNACTLVGNPMILF